MRALGRLALSSTSIATALLVAGAAWVFHEVRPLRSRLPPPVVEQPVVQAVDWTRIAPEIRAAVEQAQAEGLQLARAELDSLHAEMMNKVDGSLLDWYFGYWTQQRLGMTYAYEAGKTWLAGFVTETDPDAAQKALQEEVARAFELRVMPEPMLEERLQTIARQSVAVFVRSLEERLQDIPKRYRVPPAQWDRYLDGITLMIGGTEGNRSVPMTLKALSTGVILSGVGMSAALAPYVTAQFTQNLALAGAAQSSRALAGSVGRRAATTLSRQVAARGLAAGAGSWGGAVTGGVALVALVAWEAWDHKSTVAENRPLLRGNIDRYLKAYEDGLLQPHGMIGSILHDMETRIAANVPG